MQNIPGRVVHIGVLRPIVGLIEVFSIPVVQLPSDGFEGRFRGIVFDRAIRRSTGRRKEFVAPAAAGFNGGAAQLTR
jgi:hypothetical protein